VSITNLYSVKLSFRKYNR